MTEPYYVVKRGMKYLHLTSSTAPFWGNKKGAFHFYSGESAIQIACGLTAGDVRLSIVYCEGEGV